MRSRNLKPAIFSNELLAVDDPLYTVIFEGLWCMADREGRLEDRPAKIHMEINPGRAFEGTQRSLAWLHENGFILRTTVESQPLIQVIAFKRHQRPHKNEVPSTLPPIVVDSGPSKSTVEVQPRSQVGHNQGTTNMPHCEPKDALTPSCLIPSSLTADTLLTNSVSCTAGSKRTAPRRGGVSRETPPDWWLDFKLAYPERQGDPNWRGAQRAANARLTEGHTPAEFLAGAQRYANFCRLTGKTGSETVQQASRFLGPGKPFLLPWDTSAANGAKRTRPTRFADVTAGAPDTAHKDQGFD